MKTTREQHLKVAIAVVVDNGRALLVRRIAPKVPEYDKKWELPGGKIEPGETAESAMVREVWEETGFQVEFVRLLPLQYTAQLVLMDPPLSVDVQCGVCTLRQAQSMMETLQTSKPGSHDYAWFRFEDIPYDNVIPGSREFILWTSNELDYAIPPGAAIYHMALESIDHAMNRQRGYRVELIFRPERPKTPFVLEIWNGRKQSWEQVRRAYFATMQEALVEAMKRIGYRKRHGYSVVNIEDNHPLRSWLAFIEIPTDETAYPKLFDDRQLLR